MKEQADSILKQHKSFHTKKTDVSFIGSTQFKQFTSVRSYLNTVSTLSKIGTNLGVARLKEITPEMAAQYLQDRKEQQSKTLICASEKDYDTLSQKTLDAERKALSILLGKDLERVCTSQNPRRASRSYTNAQFDEIKKAQRGNNKLSSELARASGLRASELLTIKRANEDSKSNSRKWRDDRFEGRDGVIYVVTGKGGLKREVLIPKELAQKLESKRLSSPKIVYDRSVKITSYYDLAGGQSFSKSFSDASNRQLGFSHGAHGLRHSYAKERYEELRLLGKSSTDAKLIVSQELGHFRPSIVEVYLR